MRNFKNLTIWKRSFELVDMVYELSKDLPSDEKYGLTSQIRRSAVSIPSNIAEASGRKTDKEFARFLEIALGSAFELETQLLIVQKRKMLDQEKLETIISELVQIQKMIYSFYSNLKAKG